MAIFGKDERNILFGVAIGAGLGYLASRYSSSIKEVGRPLAKAGIKAGILAYDQAVESLAQIGESVEDMVAEARSEIDTVRKG